MRCVGIALLVAAVAAGAAVAAPRQLPVSEPSTTEAVAGLELLDAAAGTSRSVASEGGVYYRLCDRGSFGPCQLRHGAAVARRQAYALARAILGGGVAPVVIVALPQTPTRYALLVFERDTLAAAGALAATARRLYEMAGLVECSPGQDCLQLVRLRAWPAPPSGR